MVQEGYERGFYQSSKAWYHDAIKKTMKDHNELDYISIGVYPKDEPGTVGEFSMQWTLFDGEWSPKLVLPDDAWQVFFEDFKDLHETLKTFTDRNLQPDEIADELRKLGLKDRTPTTFPSAETKGS